MVRLGLSMGWAEEWAWALLGLKIFGPGLDLNICGLGLDMGSKSAIWVKAGIWARLKA